MRSSKLELGLQLILLLIVVLLLLGGYVFFISSRLTIPGFCVLRSTTGLLCAFCGGTRALESLVSGNIVAAIRYNMFVVLLIPVFFVACFLLLRCIWQRRSLASIQMPVIYIWLFLIFLVLFTVVRNLLLLF